MEKNWYVIRSKPNMEQFLAEQLKSRKIDYYLPQLSVHPANPRARKVRPFFPGYLFVSSDIVTDEFTRLNRMPGAIGMVNFGGDIAIVPDSILYAIRLKVEQINDNGNKSPARFSKGDKVKIQTGPFKGYDAIFDTCIDSGERVRVFLTMVQRCMLEVELPAAFLN